MLHIPGPNTPPDLPKRMLEPAGFAWARLTTDDGIELRYGRLAPVDAKFDCILVSGFCEFVEKYFELITDLAGRGAAVWCFDWRGQGGSTRPRHKPNRPRMRDIARDTADLKAIAALLEPSSRPRVLIGHSMGGAIALHALNALPTLFHAAILSAPMIAVATGALPRPIARAIAATADILGAGLSLIPGLRLLDSKINTTPETSATSHDPVRCQLMTQWVGVHSSLRLDGITFGWYRGALALGRELQKPTECAHINIPLLFGVAGNDMFVESDAITTFAKHLPSATIATFPTSKHELFQERDDIRNQWLAAIDAFLAKNVTGPTP